MCIMVHVTGKLDNVVSLVVFHALGILRKEN